MKLFGVIFMLVGLLFSAVGVGMAWHQDRRIRTFIPADAIVISAAVEEHVSTDSDGHRSTSYKPVVEYRYAVGGASFVCNKATPLNMSAGREWAGGIVAAHPPGKNATAYYNPANPADAFLVRKYEFFPYIFVLFPMIFTSVGLGVLIGGGASRTRPPAPVEKTGGWFELQAAMSIGARRRAWTIAAVAWHGIGLAAYGHYFALAEPPFATEAIVITAIYAGAGLAPLIAAVYFALLGRRICDPRVCIDRPVVAAGDTLKIAVQQKALSAVLAEEIRVGLVCDVTTKTKSGSKTTYSTSTCFEKYETVSLSRETAPGELLQAACSIDLPTNCSPSSPPGDKSYPNYKWRVSVRTKLAKCPDYRGNFPVTVTACASGQAGAGSPPAARGNLISNALRKMTAIGGPPRT